MTGCSSTDATRLGVIVTGMRGGVLMTEELLANGLPVDGISGSLVGGTHTQNPLAVPADPVSKLNLPALWWPGLFFSLLGQTFSMPCLGIVSVMRSVQRLPASRRTPSRSLVHQLPGRHRVSLAVHCWMLMRIRARPELAMSYCACSPLHPTTAAVRPSVTSLRRSSWLT